MIKKIMFIMLITLMVLSASVQAQTITMANPGGTAERDIAVYYPNGTLQGLWNSTSVITIDSSLDYIFTLKPIQLSIIDDPSDWLTNNAFPYVRTNIVALILILFVVGVLVARR